MYVNICRKAGDKRREHGVLSKNQRDTKCRVRLHFSPRPIFELPERPEASSCSSVQAYISVRDILEFIESLWAVDVRGA